LPITFGMFKHPPQFDLGELTICHPLQQVRAEFELPLPPRWPFLRPGQIASGSSRRLILSCLTASGSPAAPRVRSGCGKPRRGRNASHGRRYPECTRIRRIPDRRSSRALRGGLPRTESEQRARGAVRCSRGLYGPSNERRTDKTSAGAMTCEQPAQRRDGDRL